MATCVAEIYLASAVDNATEAGFFELQVMAPPAIVMTYPLVNFLSDPPAQLVSQIHLFLHLVIHQTLHNLVQNFGFLLVGNRILTLLQSNVLVVAAV